MAVVEIAGAEGLQRMRLGQGLEQLLTVAVRQSPTGGEMVTQLADQDRGRTLAVVADAVTDPADIELMPGREQGFEQQVAVIFTSRAVTGAVVAAHQVEVQRWLRTRVIAVVHAQQADQL